ncbi:Uncharacterised protein [Escherichia coli]|nr:Uncharacterised protein [Escherichia coli]
MARLNGSTNRRVPGGMVFHLQQEGTEPLVFGRTKLTNHVALQWLELIRNNWLYFANSFALCLRIIL